MARFMSAVFCSALLLAATGLAANATAAAASPEALYVTGESSPGAVVAIPLATLTAATPITAGIGPFTYAIAISPDGGRAFSVSLNGSISSIETATAAATKVTSSALTSPGSVAVSPDGSQVYIGNVYTDTVGVVNAHTLAVSSTPITVGEWPEGIAFTPDGGTAFTANTSGETVSVINTASRTVAKTITTGLPKAPCGLAVTPDGSQIVLIGGCGASEGGVSIINPATDTATPLAALGNDHYNALAMAPDGSRAYLYDGTNGDVKVLEMASDEVAPAPLVEGQAEVGALAISPDGRSLFATRYSAGTVSKINTASGAISPISTGLTTPWGDAATPDQAPHAAFSITPAPAGRATAFDAAATSTSDGGPASYAWSFGDGTSATSASSTVSHVYAQPGNYAASLTVTDDAGCSTKLIYTGQTASCNGGPAAAVKASVTVSAAIASAPHCVVPKLKGKKLKAVKKKLKKAHCKLGKVKGHKSKAAKVIKQSPKSGKVLAPGTKVSVKLGRPSARR